VEATPTFECTAHASCLGARFQPSFPPVGVASNPFLYKNLENSFGATMARLRIAVFSALVIGGTLMPARLASQRQQVASTGSQSGTPTGASRKRITASRLAGTAAPKLDGHLDDVAWQRATWYSDFTAKEPVEGSVPSVKTEVAFVYDQDALYIAARMHNAKPWDAQPIMTKRDNYGSSEAMLFVFDSFHDRRTGYAFAVTPAGVRVDYYQPTDNEMSRDYGYNPVWEARTNIERDSWTAELRIPFSQLRFNDAHEQVWGINIDRWIPSRNEDIFWVVIPRSETGWSSRFGELVGIEGVRPSRRLELSPYVATTASVNGAPDAADPFAHKSSAGMRMGGDLKMGLGPNLTLDATVNPDFGQVDADPAEVNLSAFETFFPERRPFFSEGSDVLSTAGMFNSRRIGAAPHGTPAGDYIDTPNNSTILGAAKLSGRLPGNWSIAALGALTGREYARTYTLTGSQFADVKVEPLTGYGVLRARKQFGPAASTVGGIVTGVHRDISAHDPLLGLLNHDAVGGALDWDLRFAGGKYEFIGNIGATYVAGDSTDIARGQRASARYFQRPDQPHVTYDTSRTFMSGYRFDGRLQKNSGLHWLWSWFTEVESPGLEQNDIGRLVSGDDIDTYVDLRYRESRPGKTFHGYSTGLSARRGYNFGGIEKFSGISMNADATLTNYWNGYMFLGFTDRALSDDLTRGGPLMMTPRGVDVYVNLGSNFRLPTSAGMHANAYNNEFGGWGYGVGVGVTAKPSGRATLSINPNYNRATDARQYITTIADLTSPTYGSRYIFSYIDRSTLSAQFRLNYSFTPNLALDTYAEPFVASGHYYKIGELPAARSNALRQYGTDGSRIGRAPDGSYEVDDRGTTFTLANPDFNVRSFRSNVVLRWEWRAGSTLFLVWQQNRSASYTLGDPVRPRELLTSALDVGNQYFALKLSYWLPLN
jgi:hypothetical protein